MAQEKCHDCWNFIELCICDAVSQDRRYAQDYLICAANAPGGVVHPTQKEHATRWVRLVGLRETGDPTAYLSEPWDRPMRVALEVVGLLEPGQEQEQT